MEELANSAGRHDLAARWLDAVRAVDPAAPENPAELARIGLLYRDYLLRCREERSLCFVQPGRFALANEAADPAALFFPLSAVRSGVHAPRGGTMSRAAAPSRRLSESRCASSTAVFGRMGKQVLLVDLLSALQQGRDAFTDLGLAIRSISDAFDDLRNPLLRLLPLARVDRLALAATKADHVTADQHANLVNLLRDLIGEPFLQATARPVGPAGRGRRCAPPPTSSSR